MAEDHEINQMVVAGLLEQAGYQADVVGNGRQALEAVLAGTYDLVLMDCQMPEMDGYEATRAIRQAEHEGRVRTRRGARLPVIALTASAIKGDRERCLEAGMDDYLTKPLSAQSLRTMLTARLSPPAPSAGTTDTHAAP